jgi:molecular chaperone DnaJ
VVQSNGIFAIRRPCPACHGEGRVVRDPCPQCSGSGFVRQRIRREIKIPPGVDGTKPVRVRGEGEPSPDGGPAGNLECLIRVREHPLFQRHGRDLVCQIPISYAQAALGATIEVPTLDGREELPIPRGTQNGAVFRIPGQGMPGPRRAGDLIVQVYIEVPRRLSAEHERLLRQLAEIEDEHVTPERKSFFARLKEYFQSE